MSNVKDPTDAVDKRRQNAGEGVYANQHKTGEYQIGTLEFPIGLRQKPDMQHYVAFYINVRDKSTKGKVAKEKNYIVSNNEQARLDAIERSNFSQQAIEKARENIKDNAGYVVGALTVGALTKSMLGKTSTVGDLIKAAGFGLAGGVATGIAVDKALEFLDKREEFASGKTSRLKEVITLHVSERPAVKYGTNYTNKDMGLLTGLMVQGSAKGSLKEAVSGAGMEIGAALLTQLAKVPSLKAGGGMISDVLEMSTRQKVNPFREVLFESVDYRSFQFSYKFFPKDKNETEKIENIIRTFKQHMHPELTDNKMFYIYPSEFDIEYFYKDKINPHIHRFARCALTNMSVEYGGEQFVTFEDGSPVEINMSLTFQELEQMTSEGITKNEY
jgi:hypothetical protein